MISEVCEFCGKTDRRCLGLEVVSSGKRFLTQKVAKLQATCLQSVPTASKAYGV